MRLVGLLQMPNSSLTWTRLDSRRRAGYQRRLYNCHLTVIRRLPPWAGYLVR
jgi:hypothetical protein